jgi:hypothetical protein
LEITGRFGRSANPGPLGTRSDEPADGGADGTTAPLGGTAHPAGINATGNHCQGREERNMEGLLGNYHETMVAKRAHENARTRGPGRQPAEY